MGWNILREKSGTLTSVCTFTHRRNCSRKVASVQPIRQGFIGLVRAFLHMVLSCLESNWNQGSPLKENQKTRGEILHFGHTHTSKPSSVLGGCPSNIVQPRRFLSGEPSHSYSELLTRQTLNLSEFSHSSPGRSFFQLLQDVVVGPEHDRKGHNQWQHSYYCRGSPPCCNDDWNVSQEPESLTSLGEESKRSKWNSTETSVGASGPFTKRKHR